MKVCSPSGVFFFLWGFFSSYIVNNGNSRDGKTFYSCAGDERQKVTFDSGGAEGKVRVFFRICVRDCEFFFRVMDMDPVWYAGCVHACRIPQKLRVRGATLPRGSSDGDVSVSLVGETSSLSHSPRVCDVEPAGSPGSRLAGDA